MRRTNLDDLAAFVAVARQRSFTKAAAKLGVSQSALSHTMRELETRLGVRLLTRTTRSVSPTEAGGRLLHTLAPRFEEIEIELAAVRELREKPAGTIRITATEYAADAILLPKLAKLNLYTTKVTDAGLDPLKSLPSLKWLNLDKTAVTDAGLPKLKPLANLEFLHLGANQEAVPETLQGMIDEPFTAIEKSELEDKAVEEVERRTDLIGNVIVDPLLHEALGGRAKRVGEPLRHVGVGEIGRLPEFQLGDGDVDPEIRSQSLLHALDEQPADMVHVHVGQHDVGHGREIDAGGI